MVYSDADTEDLSREQLTASLAWHPSLSNAEEVVMPEVDSFVWFTLDQRPCLAKVVAVDASLPRPLTVRLYEALGLRDDFVFDSFGPAVNPEAEEGPMVKQIAVHEVIFRFDRLTTRGFMSATVRRRLLKVLSR